MTEPPKATVAQQIAGLRTRLSTVRDDCLAAEKGGAALVASAHASFRASAANLLHYLAFRTHELRPDQGLLALLGLSSLGRAESAIVPTLEAVLGVLARLADPTAHHADGDSWPRVPSGREQLEIHARRLLGPAVRGRGVRIMVTLPSECATDPLLVRQLLEAGMTIARINTAHDSAADWLGMCRTVRSEAQAAGVECRILMDLAGPKLRTGPLEPGPAVLKVRPEHDLLGWVTQPGTLSLAARSGTGRDSVPSVDPAWLQALNPAELVTLTDARGRRRELRVVESTGSSCVLACDRATYLVPGTALARATAGSGPAETTLSGIDPLPGVLQLAAGDGLLLSRSGGVGRAARRDRQGMEIEPARLSITLPQVLDDIKVGDSIWFDDGRIGAAVRECTPQGVLLEVTHAAPGGSRLRADQGINLPDSDLRLPALTERDLEVLPFAAQNADMVGLSFVRQAEDVAALQDRLAELGGDHIGVVLKIETRRGFENLPSLLLALVRSPAAGVMIARGDLAVECGYERLAEVQEEILWLCEAAHVPVIWATQVLETLAKTGQPSRAEVTDAAMSERAECVMLNKGPFVVEAVRFLDSVLRRMQEHQRKKHPMLRPLGVARRFRDRAASPRSAPRP